MKTRLTLRIFLTLGLFLGCFAAQAESDSLTIEADTIRFDSDSGNSVFEGNVMIVRGGLEIWADLVEYIRNEQDGDRVVASGTPVRFTFKSPDDESVTHGSADQSVYLVDMEIIQMTGNVIFKDDRTTLRTHKASYNMQSGEFRTVSGDSSNSEAGRQTFTTSIDDN